MAKERCGNCQFFKEEVTEALFAMGKYVGECLRRRKDRLVMSKGSRCKLFIPREVGKT
jgi:hypothetical protein